MPFTTITLEEFVALDIEELVSLLLDLVVLPQYYPVIGDTFIAGELIGDTFIAGEKIGDTFIANQQIGEVFQC